MNDSVAPEKPEPKKPGRIRRRWTGGILLFLIVVLGFFVVRVALRLSATPDYWEAHQSFLADTPEPQLEHLAQDIQSRTLREWSYPIGDGDGIRTVRYPFDEINAWLATRLKPLMRNQNLSLPAEVGEFMLTQRDGQLVLAFDYESRTLGPRIASLYFEFKTEDDQPAAAKIQSARAGEQRLILGYLVQPIAEQPSLADPEIQATLKKIAKRQFIDLPPIPVDDHREAQVLGVQIDPAGIDLLIQVSYHDR